MVGQLLLRGLLVGILAGLLAVGFGKMFGEPSVERAIAFESTMDHADGAAHEPELVSRETQSGIGLLTAGVMYGAGLGGFFALAFALAYGRIGPLGARATAAVLAGVAFTAVTLVPMIKYPASPPSVGDPETIGVRTALFFGLLVLSIAAATLAIVVGRRLAVRLGAWRGGIAGGTLFVALIGVAYAVLPAVNEVPESFPAVTLWNFRMASLGMQVVVWATFALVFGWLAEHCLGERRGSASQA